MFVYEIFINVYAIFPAAYLLFREFHSFHCSISIVMRTRIINSTHLSCIKWELCFTLDSLDFLFFIQFAYFFSSSSIHIFARGKKKQKIIPFNIHLHIRFESKNRFRLKWKLLNTYSIVLLITLHQNIFFVYWLWNYPYLNLKRRASVTIEVKSKHVYCILCRRYHQHQPSSVVVAIVVFAPYCTNYTNCF